MKPDLYICHTAYQVLVEACRAFEAPCPPALVLSAALPGAEALAERLRATGLFAGVRVFDEEKCGNAFQKGFWRTLLFQRVIGRRNVEKYYGFSLDGARYRDVYIHNDWSVLGRYLQDKGLRYILCEDTFASTCAEGGHLLIRQQRALPHFALRQAFGYGYLYWGDWKKVKAIETESIEKATVPFARERLLQRRQKAAFAALTKEQKALLSSVFITTPLPADTAGAVLFLTRDFVSEGLMDEETQRRMYKAVAAKHCSGGPLFIKAHPRDASDYAALFPGAVVLDRTMPSEVLNFALPFRFAKAVTVESTVLKAFEAADEKVSLTLDEALAEARA